MEKTLTLWCPFDGGVRSHVDLVNERTQRWAERHGFSERLRRQSEVGRFTWLVAQFYPTVEHDEQFQLVSDWTSWLFWHDDVCDETHLSDDPEALRGRLEKLFRVLEGTDEARVGDVFEVSLSELGESFRRLAPDADWFYRFLVSVREYFEACVWEARNRLQHVVPAIDDFKVLRQCAGGMWIYLDFVEFLSCTSLTMGQRKRADVRRAVEITNNVASWHNDLFSYSKEVGRGDVHNLVVVLKEQHDVSVSSAFQLATSMIHNEILEFTQIQQRVHHPLLENYLDALGHMMRGNLDWSASSGRYSAQGGLPELRITPCENASSCAP